MTEQGELELSVTQRDADLLSALFRKADRVFVKKLSNNDRDWARLKNKRQAGVRLFNLHL